MGALASVAVSGRADRRHATAIVPAHLVDRLARGELAAAQIDAGHAHQRQRPTVPVAAHPLDRRAAGQAGSEVALRGDRVTRRAATAAAAMAGQLGRVDRDEADALASTAEGVAIDGDE